MRILVTGSNGFSAKHLTEKLKFEKKHSLFFSDVSFTQEDNKQENHIFCDLTSYQDVYSMLVEIRPQKIYHLAGSFSNQYEIDYAVNVLASKNILDVVLDLNIDCRILFIGSAAEYGLIDRNPVNEADNLNPVSIYGLTKVYQTYLMKSYVLLHNIDIVMARPFNLYGKGISKRLFVGRIMEQINLYQSGQISEIRMGNLKSRRDYISIEEAIENYMLIMDYGDKGEIYNVGRGYSISLSELLQQILKENNLSMDIVKSDMIVDTNKYDIDDIYADINKLKMLEKKSVLVKTNR